MRFADRLDGALNFNTQKTRVFNLLEENDLDDYVTKVVKEPSDDNGKATHNKNQAKAKSIIFDYVQDHLIAIISPLKTAKDCFDALIKLFEMKTPSRKRVLKIVEDYFLFTCTLMQCKCRLTMIPSCEELVARV